MSESLAAIFEGSRTNIGELSKLLAYGRQKGFENFLNRKQIWPFLLGLDAQQLSNSIYEWDGEMDRNSPDFEQLQKDAERALASMKTFENITKFHLQKRQRDVLKVLDSFFSKNPSLKYIQGFHDVASIFLVLFGNSTGYYMMQKSGKTYFRDFLTKDIGDLSTLISDMVFELLFNKDKEFQVILQSFQEMRQLIFIVPWVLTWFSHVFSSVKIICRIWDYILCTGPHGIIYLTTGIILSTKFDLKAQCPQFDQAYIHKFYQDVAKNESIDIEKAIQFAIQLQDKFPLTTLKVYYNIEPKSIFISENFEHHIDMHRQVREHNKQVKEKEEAYKRKIMIGGTVLLVAAGAMGYFVRKKYFHG